MGRGTVAAGDGGGAATSRHSPSVSPPGCHLPMASPQGGIQAATGPPRSTQSRFRFLQLPAPASPAMLHRTRREGLEGKFCSTDVVQPTRTCTMKNYVLPALGLLALAPPTARAKDEPVKRTEEKTSELQSTMHI